MSTAPHLPEEIEQKKQTPHSIVILVICAALIGGFVGGLFAIHSLLPQILDQFITMSTLPPALAPILDEQKREKISFANMSDVTKEFVINNDVRGHGVGFTSDGWVISHRQVFEFGKLTLRDNNRAILPIQKSIVDQSTDLVFVKVNASSWQVPRVSDAISVETGETVYIATAKDGILTAHATSLYFVLPYSNGIANSEHYERVISLDSVLSQTAQGAGVFNSQGILVGIVNARTSVTANTTVIPISHVLNSFREAVSDGDVSTPYFGVRYEVREGARIDMTNEDVGILVHTSKKSGFSAVRIGSPAERAGIIDGDKIISVEQTEVGRNKGLAEVILSYQPNQTVQVVVERNGTRRTVPVTLGTLK